MLLGDFYLAPAQIFLMSLEVGLDVAELAQKLIVLQDLDILDVEVGLVVALEALIRLAWVHTLQDAELSEVLQTELQSANGI